MASKQRLVFYTLKNLKFIMLIAVNVIYSAKQSAAAQLKIYREAAPDWYSDEELKALVTTHNHNVDAINSAIARLWEDVPKENEWESKERKKPEKKKVKRLSLRFIF